MVHPKSSKGKKNKSKSRPAAEKLRRADAKNDVLDTPGHEISDRGVHKAIKASDAILEPIKAVETIPIVEQPEIEKLIAVETLDSMEFTNGKNKLTVVLKKNNNRTCRMQIYLNEETEIRPSTYIGSTAALSFWKLLKGSMK